MNGFTAIIFDGCRYNGEIGDVVVGRIIEVCCYYGDNCCIVAMVTTVVLLLW